MKKEKSENKTIIWMIFAILLIASILGPFYLGVAQKDFHCNTNVTRFWGSHYTTSCTSVEVFGELFGAWGIGILILVLGGLGIGVKPN